MFKSLCETISDGIELPDMFWIVDKTPKHHRRYHEGIYTQPNGVSLHTLLQHRIVQHMDLCTDNWDMIDCHRIRYHFGIHLERNDSMGFLCIQGNMCILVSRGQCCRDLVHTER